jgi:hypothetical protein
MLKIKDNQDKTIAILGDNDAEPQFLEKKKRKKVKSEVPDKEEEKVEDGESNER